MFSFVSQLFDSSGDCTVFRHGDFAEACKGCTLGVGGGVRWLPEISHLAAPYAFGGAWKGLWGQ